MENMIEKKGRLYMNYCVMEVLICTIQKLQRLECLLIDKQINTLEAEDYLWDNDPVDLFRINPCSALYSVIKDMQHDFIARHKI